MKKLLLFLSLLLSNKLYSTEAIHKYFILNRLVESCEKCGIKENPYLGPKNEPEGDYSKIEISHHEMLEEFAIWVSHARNNAPLEEKAKAQQSIIDIIHCSLDDLYKIPKEAPEYAHMHKEALEVIFAGFSKYNS